MDDLYSALIAAVIVTICIAMHYEALAGLERVTRALKRHRWVVLLTMYGLFVTHIAQIWLFGMGYYVAENWFGLGEITSPSGHWLDYVYYSADVYTTVGFGDVLPESGLRMLSSAESLAGFLLITWSASFTFLQMQRLWRP